MSIISRWTQGALEKWPKTVYSKKLVVPTLPGAGAGARHSGRLTGHLGIRMLGFYLVGDGILEQKNIRIDTVFREHM